MDKKKVVKKEATFSKKQLINSKTYKHRVDLLNALLDDNKRYTKLEVNKKINKFLKGSVK